MGMVDSKKSVGVPIKLLHESEKHTISLELKNKIIIKGELYNSEDNMNLHLKKAVVFYPFYKNTQNTNDIFIRGNQIKLIVIPTILKNAPMFKRINPVNKNDYLPKGIGILGKSGAA